MERLVVDGVRPEELNCRNKSLNRRDFPSSAEPGLRRETYFDAEVVMIRIRRCEKRGRFDHGWLDTRHTFSFGDYHDPRFMGFRELRVINEDRVRPGQGFGTHGHRDMEIISYVLEGGLAHRDSLGNGSVIVPGDVQYMSAGTGVRHSEFNASKTEPVHFMQIWIVPKEEGLPPRYDQKRFDEGEKRGRLRLVASGSGADGSIALRQDVRLYASLLEPGQAASMELSHGRHLWVQVLRGALDVNGNALAAGDGLAASDEIAIRFSPAAGASAEFLAFDLA
jgi:redox-sensitive bicupin YhaK (pirin superfamily)